MQSLYPIYNQSQFSPQQYYNGFNNSPYVVTDSYCGQSPQTCSQGAFLRGHKVNGDMDILPHDVPMDGTTSYFPTSDGSCIYAKSWNSDGTIGTIRYVRESVEAQAKAQDPFDQITEQLDRIEASLKNRSGNRQNQKGENNG